MIICFALVLMWAVYAFGGRRIDYDYHPDADLVRRRGDTKWLTPRQMLGEP